MPFTGSFSLANNLSISINSIISMFYHFIDASATEGMNAAEYFFDNVSGTLNRIHFVNFYYVKFPFTFSFECRSLKQHRLASAGHVV